MRKRWLAVVVVLIGLAPPAVARAAVPTNVVRPRVTGEDGRLFPGSVLTETPGVWTGEPTSLAVQWLTCRSTGAGTFQCTPIPGATGHTYSIRQSDVGANLTAQEIATNADGSSLPAAAIDLTNTVQPTPPPIPSPTPEAPAALTPLPPPPESVTAPVISGRTVVGATLTTTPGTWTGVEPISFSYQWLFCRPTCVPIAGATGPTILLTSAYVGGRMITMVRATNPGGAGVPVYSRLATFPIGYSAHDLLLQTLTLDGKPRRIGRLLRHGGYSAPFDAPHPGVVRITWTAPVTKHGKRTRVLVAGGTELVTGRQDIRIDLTPKGTALLRHARRLQITAKAVFRVGKRTIATATAPQLLRR